MFRPDKRWFLVNVFIFCFNLLKNAAAHDCCPKDTYIVRNRRVCSDNHTTYDLKCERGAYILDPFVDERDQFSFNSSANVLAWLEESLTKDEFCVGKLQRNDSEGANTLVALVCFKDTPSWNDFTVFHQILMVASIFFLLLTFCIYLCLPSLRDLQGKCVMTFILTLSCSFVIILLGHAFQTQSDEGCVIQAGFLYFFLSATFFWSNLITFNIWRAVRNASTKIQDSNFLFYIGWGCGIPFVMVVVAFVLQHVPGGNHLRPHFGVSSCWFVGDLETWSYFYGPVSVLLILNTMMFLHSCWTLWRSCKDVPVSKIGSLRFKWIMYLKLFLLMGIAWIFEIFAFASKAHKSFHENAKYLWFLTDSLNASQGIIIFLILVVFRHKVKHELYTRRVGNVNWPRSWGEKKMEESLISCPEEMELDNGKVKLKDQPF